MAMMAGSAIGSGDGNVADGGNAGGYPLRRWQRECLRAWVRAGRRGIVDVATGAGKTALALAAVKEAEARTEGGQMRVRVIVPKVFLARQWLTDIMAQLGVRRGEIGICSGELREPDRRVTIYVLNTARTAVSKHILDDLRSGRSVFLI
ncbi:MAG: DEAD/DEAH box helicase family protein, partial [Clostridiales bacterium]|nr:DEAD/DEAH box helicase family protein [Clostridiales bacterium]